MGGYTNGRPLRRKPFRRKPLRRKPFRRKPFRRKPFRRKPFRRKPLRRKPFRRKPFRRKPFRRKPFRRKPLRRKPLRRKPFRRKPFRRKPFRRKPFRRKPFRRKPFCRKPFRLKGRFLKIKKLWKNSSNWKQKQEGFCKHGIDIFAPTNQVQSLARGFADELKTESTVIEDASYIWLSSIKEVLEQRCNRLLDSENLNFGAIYDDDDKNENLANLHQVFEQLQFHLLSVGTTERKVVWFVTGYIKFLGSIYGHIGLSATHPCILCEALKAAFKNGGIFPERTLSSIDKCFLLFRQNTQSRLSITNAESIGSRQKILKRLIEESYIRNCLFDTHVTVVE
uniref:Uncharacterized protein n=1 Tax=Ditylenchus dipsaci TaxID=166011 RepID=A0A915EIS6_9BILA